MLARVTKCQRIIRRRHNPPLMIGVNLGQGRGGASAIDHRQQLVGFIAVHLLPQQNPRPVVISYLMVPSERYLVVPFTVLLRRRPVAY